LQKEALEASTMTELPTTLIGQWLLELVMDGIDEGVVQAPPPIVSRAFQEFSNGMVAFHDGMKLGTTPFPFPYSQITATMLLTHLFVTPFVMCTWVLWPTWVFIVTCLVTMVFWSLFFTALDIENPFQPGDTRSQYEATRVQKEFNSCLLLLLSQEARSIPTLTAKAVLEPKELLRQRVAMPIHVPRAQHTAEEDDLRPKMSARSTNSRETKRPSFLQRLAQQSPGNTEQAADRTAGKQEQEERTSPLSADEPSEVEPESAGAQSATGASNSSTSRDRNTAVSAMNARARAVEVARADNVRLSLSGICPTPSSQSSEFSFGPTGLHGAGRPRDPPGMLSKSDGTLAL